MAVPSRAEAAALLASLDPPGWFVTHTAAVADVAAFLAARLRARGHRLEPALVEAAALLHDVDKLLPGRVANGLPHGEAGAAWLAAQGMPELSAAVAGHPISTLADAHRAAAWLARAGWEERLVAYADKRAGQSLQSLAERLDDMARRHPAHAASIDAARPAAERLEALVCAAAGVAPAAVRGEAWAVQALAAAGTRDAA